MPAPVTRRSTPISAGVRHRARRRLVLRAVSWAVAVGVLFTVPASTAAGGLNAPLPPRSLTVGSVSKTSIQLSWVPSRSRVSVAGYRIYVNGALRRSVRSTSYQVGRLRCGSSYVLSVGAYDVKGHGSRLRSRTVRTLPCQLVSDKFSATFDCYGSGPNCAGLTPRRCTATIGGDLQTSITNGAAGSVICLNTGNYGDISLTSVAKTSDVTIQPAPGATVKLGYLTVNASTHLHFTGVGGGGATMSINGTIIDVSSGCSNHLAFDHITYTAGVIVLPKYGCSTDMALLWDHDRFDNLPNANWEGRFNVQAFDTGPSAPNGITISNSHFGGNGPGNDQNCSDGIQLQGGAYGTVIGPGNEFTNVTQGSCSAHVDTIQGVHAPHTTVTGNWFHSNGDGSSGPQRGPGDDFWFIWNNVIEMTSATTKIDCSSCRNDLLQHNVIIDGLGALYATNSNLPDLHPTNDVIRDNVFVGTARIGWDETGSISNDHNLNAGGPGVGNRKGMPVFVGGTKPASYAGYRLAPRSPGKESASNGGDMGIRPPS